jgi:hypothetical protein
MGIDEVVSFGIMAVAGAIGSLFFAGALAYVIGFTWTRGQYEALTREFKQRKP